MKLHAMIGASSPIGTSSGLPNGMPSRNAARRNAALALVSTRRSKWEAKVLAAAGQIKPPHVLRKMALDLVCYSHARNEPPPVKLLRRALELPTNHMIGAWAHFAGKAGKRDGRMNIEARSVAQDIDFRYYNENGEKMKQTELERRIKKESGRTPGARR